MHEVVFTDKKQKERGVTTLSINTDSPVIPQEELPFQAAMGVATVPGLLQAMKLALRGLHRFERRAVGVISVLDQNRVFGEGQGIDKAVAVIFPISAFVASGYEHSVANMYFIPVALLVRRDAAFEADPALTWDAFLLDNLLPVTIGNVVGGTAPA